MLCKKKLVPILLALCCLPMTAANAQLQNWATNEANKILQDQSSGLLNPNQASQLQNRDAQIMQQEQGYLNQNGGTLTPSESQKIGNELKHLNRGVNNDVNRNNPGMVNGMYPNGYVPPTGYVPQTGGYMTPNGYVAPTNTAYPNTNPNANPYHHHHHHNWNNGVAPNGQYWNH